MSSQKRTGWPTARNSMCQVVLAVSSHQLKVFLLIGLHYNRTESYVLEALWFACVCDHSDRGLAYFLPHVILVRLASLLHQLANLMSWLQMRKELTGAHGETWNRKVVAISTQIVKVEVSDVLLFSTAVQASANFDVALLHTIMFSLTDILNKSSVGEFAATRAHLPVHWLCVTKPADSFKTLLYSFESQHQSETPRSGSLL